LGCVKGYLKIFWCATGSAPACLFKHQQRNPAEHFYTFKHLPANPAAKKWG
jgi:hypothetical protein